MNIGLTPLSLMNFFFMLGVSIILAIQPELIESDKSDVYQTMLAIAPQKIYAVTAFTTSFIFLIAFVLRSRYLEIAGLFISGAYILIVFTGYLIAFPNISAVAYGVWTLASIMSIVQVVNEIQDKKEHDKHENQLED